MQSGARGVHAWRDVGWNLPAEVGGGPVRAARDGMSEGLRSETVAVRGGVT